MQPCREDKNTGILCFNYIATVFSVQSQIPYKNIKPNRDCIACLKGSCTRRRPAAARHTVIFRYYEPKVKNELCFMATPTGPLSYHGC